MSASSTEWTEPGAYEVAPDIHRIVLPLPNDGLRAVNVYAIADGDQVVLIDSGWATDESEQQLAAGLDAIGYGLEHVSQFLITHSHSDHYTQAVRLRRGHGMPISLGAGERMTLEWITPERVQRPFAQFDQLRRCGALDIVRELEAWPPNTDVDDKTWEPPDRWLEGFPVLPLRTRTLRAIPTPGHTRGHYVFWDADAGLLFAGDHVLPQITPSLGFEAVPDHSPLNQYLTSLLLVRTMPDARLLPAHGPVTDSVHERVDQLLSHHAARLDLTLAAVAAGASTGREAAARLGWTRRGRRLDEMDVFNRMLAVLETGAHLAVLAERGLVDVTEIDGVARYAPR